MKKDSYQNLSVVFYDFHFLSEEDYPGAEPIFCFLVLKDGSLTAAHWHPFIFKEEHDGKIGEFVRGLADAVPTEQIHAWLNLGKWHFDKPEEGEALDQLTIGAEKEYSIEVKGFRPIGKKTHPQDEQYCFLLLNNGKMSGGRWSDGGPYMDAPGYFDHAAGGSVIAADEVWLWAALDPAQDALPEKAPRQRKQPEKKKTIAEKKPDTCPPKLSKTRFKYGLDVEAYLARAVETLRKNYAWVTRDDLDPHYRYAIEEEDGKFQFFLYYKDNSAKPKGKGKGKGKGKEEIQEKRQTVTDCFCHDVDTKGFIQAVVFHNEFYVLSQNKVVARHKVKFRHIRVAGGWHLEHYIFMKRASGDYTVDIQAGDMTTGANREFGIPRKCFAAPTFDAFLDEYEKIVPGNFFGLSKEELLADEKLKAFLGYTE